MELQDLHLSSLEDARSCVTECTGICIYVMYATFGAMIMLPECQFASSCMKGCMVLASQIPTSPMKAQYALQPHHIIHLVKAVLLCILTVYYCAIVLL